MAIRTQVSGKHQNQALLLFPLRQKLEKADIHIAHPIDDGFIFTQNSVAPGLVSALWTPYETNLDYYESIASSDIYLVHNDDGIITEPMARGILFALLKQKPIVFLCRPLFDESVGALVRQTIRARLNRYTLLDVRTADDRTMRAHFASVPKMVDYHLQKREKAIISAILRKHFRDLLGQTQRASTAEPALSQV
ncbi:MAG TPA: hypothetical protein VJR27_01105 [Candidatus Saccharimonadales bacterium]|nr:hypothetical protein [Candidatus Saccharimonadales bacterium]